MMKLEHSMHLLCRGKKVIDVNKMCQHTSSLLNSHNATMQRCTDNSHQKGQLSSTIDIPQLRQLEPFLEQVAMACILWMEKWEVYWTDCFFMPQGLVEIQVEQPQKDNQSLRILMASGLRLTYKLCLSFTVSLKVRDIQILATFCGTGFGIFGWENTPKL